MISVGVVYDTLTSDVKAQITRDLMILSGQWDIAVNDIPNQIPTSLLSELGIPVTGDPPEVVVVYKTGSQWPQVPDGANVVQRDLTIDDKSPTLDPNPHVGYFLRPQGRDGSNLTERYLNRSYPNGKGIVNPVITLLWG